MFTLKQSAFHCQALRGRVSLLCIVDACRRWLHASIKLENVKGCVVRCYTIGRFDNSILLMYLINIHVRIENS